MNKLIIILCISLLHLSAQSQSQLDKELMYVSNNLSAKLKNIGKTNVVCLYVTDISKNQTVAGKYLADGVSVNLVNSGGLNVFDRDNLEAISDAKALIAEGYINAEKAQRLGQLLSVNAIIVGSYTVLPKTIKLTLKVLDVSNGFVIAASVTDIELDADAKSLLGITTSSDALPRNPPNRGFNTPVNTNEQYNSPQALASDCGTLNVGEYCLFNNSKHTLTVELYYNYVASERDFVSSTETRFVLNPGESKCLSNVFAGRGRQANHFEASYKYIPSDSFFQMEEKKIIDQGDFRVEQCKSKTYYIK